MKTSKLHSLRQKETKTKQATPSKHSGTKQIATDHFAMKHGWNMSLSTELYFKMPINILCQNTLFLNILPVKKKQLFFPY